MERRRLLDIPHSEDLVFYAPLFNGNTTDIISGVELYVNPSVSLSWNVENNAYLFDSSRTSLWKTPFSWNNLSIGLFDSSTTSQNAEFTLMARSKIITANNVINSRHVPSLGYIDNQYRYCFAFANRGGFYNDKIDGLWHTYVLRVINGLATCFKDKEITLSTNMVFSLNNMSITDCNNYVSIYMTPSNTTFIGSSCLKDVRIYNRALTNDEVNIL